jgi:predicted nucleic acid-binding protein
VMHNGVLVDTSAFISFFRGMNHADEVAVLLKDNRAVVTGIIIAELLQGIKDSKEEQKIAELFQAINSVELTTELWIKAGLLAFSLRKKGIILPLTDIAIAVIALEYDLPLFTLDKHFQEIGGIKLYKPFP